jgi:hypothetical protein
MRLIEKAVDARLSVREAAGLCNAVNARCSASGAATCLTSPTGCGTAIAVNQIQGLGRAPVRGRVGLGYSWPRLVHWSKLPSSTFS